MKELKDFVKIKNLEPFTKILFVDKTKDTAEEILFLYADGYAWNNGKFYACDKSKCGAPREYNFRWYENEVYIDYTYENLNNIKEELKEISDLKRKLRKIEEQHWGYVKGKLTCFWVNTAEWKLEDINMKDVDYTVDDIESICVIKPKFEDVKKMIPKPSKDMLDKCYTKQILGKDINYAVEHNDEFYWYYKTLQYKPDKVYTVYSYCTDDAEGYCYTHSIYIND